MKAVDAFKKKLKKGTVYDTGIFACRPGQYAGQLG